MLEQALNMTIIKNEINKCFVFKVKPKGLYNNNIIGKNNSCQ